MAFTISSVPGTLAAIICEIGTAAHEDSTLARLLWPTNLQNLTNSATSTNTSDLTASAEETHNNEQDLRFLPELQNPSNYYYLVKYADDETGESKDIAFVWWNHAKGKTKKEWGEAYQNRYRPSGMNKELADATSGRRFLMRAEILGERESFSRYFLVLKELYVIPIFQRRGLGGRLVEWGIKKADELGLPAYTEASAQGLNLYLKYGFQEVGRVTVDLGEYGGEKGELNSYGILIREVRGG